MNHALVAVAAPVRSLFSYSIPDRLQGVLQPGHLVEVPFGRGARRGVVVEIGHEPPDDVEVKPIGAVVEEEPVLGPAMLRTLSWAADYYLAPPGEMFFTALPPLLRKAGKAARPKQVLVAAVTDAAGPESVEGLRRRAPRQADLLEQMLRAGSVDVKDFEKRFPGARKALCALQDKGLVALTRRIHARRPPPPDLPPPDRVQRLTGEQRRALDAICAGLDSGRYTAFLLHGVTGSGKTEVYLRAIEHALRAGLCAVLLVPEISLTPQLMNRVADRFGDLVAVLHSGLSPGERLDEWRRLQSGQARLALGARSAVFAPLGRAGIIVVDEEHDPSYKQSERLPYSGRDLAMVRARKEGAVVVMGSATPSVESYAHAISGRSKLLQLTERVRARPMPRVETIDLRTVLDPLERAHTLSPALADALAETLDAGEQAILFLNRRGYSSFGLCRDCGETVRCTNCSVALVHHLAGRELRCHYCGLTVRLPVKCPGCCKGRVQLFGLGTEKCEEEVRRRFPGARVIRLDSDSVAGRGKLQQVMARFARGEADVLVGTQMVTKGHDIPGVTLVGVVLADLGLNLPDFRAAERTFQLLMQVAGRAGRGERPGRVLIQSFMPGHESIVLAREHRYQDFFEREIARRKSLGYPPALRLLMVRTSHQQQVVAADLAAGAAGLMRAVGAGRLQLLGPVPSPLARLRGRYRFQMLVKCARIEDLHRAARAVLQRLRVPGGAKIVFDVDPVDML